MKKYKIGEFSKFMGVTLKTLKHYEKYEIVVPEVDDDSNYRYYSYMHGGRMLRSRCFTQLGFTVKETSEIMTQKSCESIVEVLDSKEEEHQREMLLLRLKIQRLKEIRKKYLMIRDHANGYSIENRKAYYFLKHVHDDEFITGTVWNTAEMLMELQPHVLQLAYHYKDELDKCSAKNNLGLGISKETAEKLMRIIPETMVLLEEQKCFLYYYSAPYQEGTKDIILKDAMALMQEEGWTLAGDVVVEGGYDQYIDGKRIYQCLIWIPIH